MGNGKCIKLSIKKVLYCIYDWGLIKLWFFLWIFNKIKILRLLFKSEGCFIVWLENRCLFIGIKFIGCKVNFFVNELNFFFYEKLMDGVIFMKLIVV